MSKKAAHLSVAEFLRANPASTKEAIGEGTGVKGIILVNALKKLTGEGGLVQEGKGKETTYSLEETPASEKTQVEPAAGEEVEEKEVAKSTGRDNSTFRYNGSDFKKSRLVLQIISDHVTA